MRNCTGRGIPWPAAEFTPSLPAAGECPDRRSCAVVVAIEVAGQGIQKPYEYVQANAANK